MNRVYDEILDVLKTREEYLQRGADKAGDWSPELDAFIYRMDELKIVRAIINTIKGEDE